MKPHFFLTFILLLTIPMIAWTQPEVEEEEGVEFAFINQTDGKPDASLFLDKKDYVDTYQYKVANEVFEALVDARGDFRDKKPTLEMTRVKKIAVANTKTRIVFLEYRAYDLCTTFGKDSLNALAAILSHELTHIYENHGWVNYYASQNKETATKDQIKKQNNRLIAETQSDHLGGFLAYSAGYQTLGIMPQFLQKVYDSYSLPDQLRNYPPLSERIKIAENSLKRLETFIHIYDMANYLATFQQYEQSKKYFDYILKEYKSREIHNNIGVIAAQIGMQYVSDKFLKYGLPLELDVDSRLKNGLRGTKEEEMAKKVLKEALDYFENSRNLDKNYPIAFLNTACVYFLLNNFDDAEYYARKTLKLCNDPKWEKTKTDVYILQGILADYQGNTDEAKMLFKKAADAGNILALTNLRILNNEPLVGTSPTTVIETEKDQIDDYSIDKAVVKLLQGTLNFDKIEVLEENKNKVPLLSCGTIKLEGSTFLTHYMDEENYTCVQVTDRSNLSATQQGIKSGSSSDEVLDKYFQPDNRVALSNGNYWVYFKNNLIFHFNKNGKVQSWGIFRIKESK